MNAQVLTTMLGFLSLTCTLAGGFPLFPLRHTNRSKLEVSAWLYFTSCALTTMKLYTDPSVDTVDGFLASFIIMTNLLNSGLVALRVIKLRADDK